MTNTPNESKIFPETIVWNGLNKPAERGDPEKRKDKLQNLTVEVGKNVLIGIADYKVKQNQSNTNLKSDKIIGSSCKNNSCKAVILLFIKKLITFFKVYDGTDPEDCLHHPGIAVFHEGMKYWSCCTKKTSDFGNFMDQVGCTTGPHCWNRVCLSGFTSKYSRQNIPKKILALFTSPPPPMLEFF